MAGPAGQLAPFCGGGGAGGTLGMHMFCVGCGGGGCWLPLKSCTAPSINTRGTIARTPLQGLRLVGLEGVGPVATPALQCRQLGAVSTTVGALGTEAVMCCAAHSSGVRQFWTFNA